MSKAMTLNEFILKKERMKFRKVNIHLKKYETKPTKTEQERRMNLMKSENNGLENKTK